MSKTKNRNQNDENSSIELYLLILSIAFMATGIIGTLEYFFPIQ